MTQTLVKPLLLARARSSISAMSARSVWTETKWRPGIAMGIAAGQRPDDFRLAVRVQAHLPSSFPRNVDIRDEFENAARGEVDFQWVGPARKLAARPGPTWFRGRRRPVVIGSSIGHYHVTAGTLGLIAVHTASARSVMLSNNHVLANESRAKTGDPILQPGGLDGGTLPGSRIGSLLDEIPLRGDKVNLSDAAIARIARGVEVEPTMIRGLGRLAGARQAPVEPGMRVRKAGRTTGISHGTVSAIEVDDLVVEFESGALRFDAAIEIEGEGDLPFSAGGDSGSAIVDDSNEVCALLFAGTEMGGSNSRGHTYACALPPILAGLGLSLDFLKSNA